MPKKRKLIAVATDGTQMFLAGYKANGLPLVTIDNKNKPYVSTIGLTSPPILLQSVLSHSQADKWIFVADPETTA